MSRYLKIALFCTLFILTIFLPVCLHADGSISFAKVESPQIIRISQENNMVARPLIAGLTPTNSDVLVYLDGVFVGSAVVKSKNTATDNFYFQFSTPIASGKHAITVVAKDKTSLVLSAFSGVREFIIPTLPAPTMIQPDENTVTAKKKPLIVGLTVSGTKALVFIDGVYNGATEIVTNESNTANFAYRPFLNLAPGWHTAWTQAEDISGRKSGDSLVLRFRIEDPNPAPTLFLPVVNVDSGTEQPIVVGVAKNNARIRVFIDKKLNGEFVLGVHPSGTANFAYKPFLRLAPGKHIIYATAVDNRGKESSWSNIVSFGTAVVSKDKDIVVYNEVRQEEVDKEAAAKAENDKPADVNEDYVKIEEKPAEKELNQDLKDIQDVLNEKKGANEEKGGLMNESKEGQAKLRLNLVIFIVFLFLVIAWIFWVNRELIKERREQNSEDNEGKGK